MDDIFTVLVDRIGSIPGNRTVVELGAADGTDTIKIANSVLSGLGYEHFAFEPDNRNITKLREVVSTFPNFKTIDAAVGNINGFVPFYECSGKSSIMPEGSNHTFSSSVKAPKLHLQVHGWCKFDVNYKVRMVRLDDFFSVFRLSRPVDLIWCDIQGAEDLMIEGAQTTLSNTRLFYSECYEQELYEGQIGRHEILKRLPGEWKMANEWENDVLFENLKFK